MLGLKDLLVLLKLLLLVIVSTAGEVQGKYSKWLILLVQKLRQLVEVTAAQEVQGKYTKWLTVRQAQLVDTDTESDPEEAPSEAEESQPLGSRVPLVSEEFEAFKPSGTRTDSSHSSASSNSTTPLSPDHLLTHVSPTPTPTHSSFYHRTTHIIRYRSSYKTPLPSLTLLVQKRYRGTSELILDTNSKGDELGDEDTNKDGMDESLGADD
ncbi:hypothetical protein Tco_0019750 [Tanacetum coccineum]